MTKPEAEQFAAKRNEDTIGSDYFAGVDVTRPYASEHQWAVYRWNADCTASKVKS